MKIKKIFLLFIVSVIIGISGCCNKEEILLERVMNMPPVNVARENNLTNNIPLEFMRTDESKENLPSEDIEKICKVVSTYSPGLLKLYVEEKGLVYILGDRFDEVYHELGHDRGLNYTIYGEYLQKTSRPLILIRAKGNPIDNGETIQFDEYLRSYTLIHELAHFMDMKYHFSDKDNFIYFWNKENKYEPTTSSNWESNSKEYFAAVYTDISINRLTEENIETRELYDYMKQNVFSITETE